MLRLGTPVKINGRDAMVVARTLAGDPRYDVRFTDGTVLKYVKEEDLEPAVADGAAARPMR